MAILLVQRNVNFVGTSGQYPVKTRDVGYGCNVRSRDMAKTEVAEEYIYQESCRG